jgi:septum formation topological specificity factor MinE
MSLVQASTAEEVGNFFNKQYLAWNVRTIICWLEPDPLSRTCRGEWNRSYLALAKECHKRRLELIIMPTRKEQPDGPMQRSILETIVQFNQQVIPEDKMIPVALLDSKYQYGVLAIEISLDHTRIVQVLKRVFEHDEKYARLSRAEKSKEREDIEEGLTTSAASTVTAGVADLMGGPVESIRAAGIAEKQRLADFAKDYQPHQDQVLQKRVDENLTARLNTLLIRRGEESTSVAVGQEENLFARAIIASQNAREAGQMIETLIAGEPRLDPRNYQPGLFSLSTSMPAMPMLYQGEGFNVIQPVVQVGPEGDWPGLTAAVNVSTARIRTANDVSSAWIL